MEMTIETEMGIVASSAWCMVGDDRERLCSSVLIIIRVLYVLCVCLCMCVCLSMN